MALRIERIDFNPWGCFADHSLPFSSRAGDVDLIHGRNASGKSTTSRGERGLLYGIDERTVDAHTHDYHDLRIGARLLLDGKPVELSRRKRRVGALVGPNGETLPDDLLLAALGGLTGEVYEHLFQVDHETLVEGGADLLQGRGEVGATLFAAAAGIASLHRVLDRLDKDADHWFNPRGRTSQLHKRLHELREAEKRMRQATLRPVRHREMAGALETDEQLVVEASERLHNLEVRVREIERKRAIAPLLDQRTRRIEELAELGDGPDLPDSAAASRTDAQGRLEVASEALVRSNAALERLDADIEAIAVNPVMLARATEIRAASDRVSEISKAASDRRKREGELQEAETLLAMTAASVGVEPNEIEALRRPVATRRVLDRNLSERDELISRVNSARARKAEAERDREEATADLAALAPAADIAGLEAALAVALKLGSVDQQITETERERLQLGEQAQTAFARLAPAPPSLEELAEVSTPSRERIARLVEARDRLHIEANGIENETRLLNAADAELAEDRERLQVEGEAPTAAALANARQGRDTTWARLRAAGTSSVPLDVGECDSFEAVVIEADRIADARTDHAAQIERTATVHAREARLRLEREELERRIGERSAHAESLASDWSAAWAQTGLDDIDLDDAVSWLDSRQAILGSLQAAAEAQQRANVLRARAGGHLDALGRELTQLGRTLTRGSTLEAAIAQCQQVVVAARDLELKRSTLTAALAGAERAFVSAERELQQASDACRGWDAAWPERRSAAGLPESVCPEDAQEIVRTIDEALGHLARVDDLRRRIAGIDADEADFGNVVRGLCADLAADLVSSEKLQAAGALARRLTEHERASERRDTLLGQRPAKVDEVATVEAEIAAAQTRIDELLALAGVDDVALLPQLEVRAARARALRREISDLEEQVATVGESRFDELAAAADGFERDRAVVELEELRIEIERLQAERDVFKERIGERKRDLADAEADVTAVNAAQDAAFARAAVAEAAAAHAKAKLGAIAVRRSIDRYRAQHQDPLLQRANELFTRFTLGSFVELFVDVDDCGVGILIGRQRDRVLKRVPEMSKGTREQLFLALRIAAIERYVVTSGPVPVIFDDVFIESDPPRSERIFEALAELANLTQVIVLTHHEHLIDVARKALKDRLVVQDLPDSTPTLREAAAA